MEPDYYNRLIGLELTGQMDRKQADELRKWRDSSPENEALYQKTIQLWHKFGKEESRNIPDIEESWKALSHELELDMAKEVRILQHRPAKKSVNMRYSVKYSVISVAAVLAFFVLFKLFNTQDEWQIAETKAGEIREVTLPDQSIVKMNSFSRLQFPEVYTNSLRIVRLWGQAFFEVKSSKKPFLVRTENAEIRVHGTSFDIFARNEKTEVIVTDGIVSLSSLNRNSSDGIMLQANQRALVEKSGIPSTPQSLGKNFMIGWLNNRFVFLKTPFAEVVAEMERRHDVHIRLGSEQLGHLTMSGTFEDKSAESSLEAFCLALNLHLSFDGESYIITK